MVFDETKKNYSSKSTTEFETLLAKQKEAHEKQDKIIELLATKVNRVKDIAIDVGEELNSQKKILFEIDDQVCEEKDKLKRLNNKLDKINGKQQSPKDKSLWSKFSFFKLFS